MTKEDVPYDILYAFILEKCAQLKIDQIETIMVSPLFFFGFFIKNIYRNQCNQKFIFV